MPLPRLLPFLAVLTVAHAAPERIGDRTDYVGTALRVASPTGLVTGSEAPGGRTLYGGYSAPAFHGDWETSVRAFDSRLRKVIEEDGCSLFGDSSILVATLPARIQLSARRGPSYVEIVVWLSPMPDERMSITYVQNETGL